MRKGGGMNDKLKEQIKKNGLWKEGIGMNEGIEQMNKLQVGGKKKKGMSERTNK